MGASVISAAAPRDDPLDTASSFDRSQVSSSSKAPCSEGGWRCPKTFQPGDSSSLMGRSAVETAASDCCCCCSACERGKSASSASMQLPEILLPSAVVGSVTAGPASRGGRGGGCCASIVEASIDGAVLSSVLLALFCLLEALLYCCSFTDGCDNDEAIPVVVSATWLEADTAVCMTCG